MARKLATCFRYRIPQHPLYSGQKKKDLGCTLYTIHTVTNMSSRSVAAQVVVLLSFWQARLLQGCEGESRPRDKLSTQTEHFFYYCCSVSGNTMGTRYLHTAGLFGYNEVYRRE